MPNKACRITTLTPYKPSKSASQGEFFVGQVSDLAIMMIRNI